jgi:hypothetical protein
MALRPLAAAAPLVVAAALAAPAAATTYCVHQDGACPAGTVDKGDGLQSALAAASAAPDPDVVTVGPGTYVGSFTYASAFPLDIVGAGPGLTTLTAHAGPAGHILASGRATVSGLRLHLPASEYWAALVANGDVSGVRIDGEPPSGDARTGVLLSPRGSLTASAIALGLTNDVGVTSFAAAAQTPRITDSSIVARHGVMGYPAASGKTVVSRATIASTIPVSATNSRVDVDNTLVRSPSLVAGLAATCGSAAGSPSYVKADHVTIIGGSEGGTALASECDQVGRSATVSVTNSILASVSQAFLRDAVAGASANVQATWTSHGPGATQIGPGVLLVKDNITDKAGLEGFAADGQRLAPSSPLIDAGAPGLPVQALDRDGLPRLFGARQDLGAYEFDPSSVPPADATPPATGAGGGEAGADGAGGRSPLAEAAGAVSDAALLAELRRTITRRPGWRGARYRHRGLVPGVLAIRWVARGRVVAKGRVRQVAPGVKRLRVKRTRAGRRLLGRGRRLRLVVRGSFAPTGRRTLRARRRAVLRRG